MKILVISSFPAPYRVGVFEEINKIYDLDIFFETTKDQNRNADWFAKNDDFKFDILDNEVSIKKYQEALSNIKGYDAVLAYDFYLKSAMKAQWQCILHKVPYFINCDGAFIKRNFIKRLVKSFFISNAAGCFASGEFAKRYFLYYGAKKENIHKHNFTSLHKSDILDVPVSHQEKEFIRAELGIENRKTVITVGQFIQRKGIEILLEAWKGINLEYQLLIIGGGELEENYKEYIRTNNLKNIRILRFQRKKQIFKYYKASDLFVLPTREDIWGLVINEAMACGLPIVTTDMCIAGMELVEDSINGYIIPVNSSKILAEKINYILSHEELSNEIGKLNIKKMQDKTIENISKNHIKVIKKIIDGANKVNYLQSH